MSFFKYINSSKRLKLVYKKVKISMNNKKHVSLYLFLDRI